MSVESAELLRQENAQKILQTVKSMFGEHNADELTLGRIAAQAGVSVRTINNIFGTKNSLLIQTAIGAYTEERAVLNELMSGTEFAQKSGLEQVMALHCKRAEFSKTHPYLAEVVSELERQQFGTEAEAEQCGRYLRLTEEIAACYNAPIRKGRRDGSINNRIDGEAIRPILFFLFGALVQRLQTLNANELMGRQTDPDAILGEILNMTKDYLGTRA